MLSIAVTYFITLCLFPGLESEVRHCVLGEWLPILIMAVFNLSDFVGKVSLQPPGEETAPQAPEWGGGSQATAPSQTASPPHRRPRSTAPRSARGRCRHHRRVCAQ